MHTKTGYLLGIILTIIVGTIAYYYVCCGQYDVNTASKTDVERSMSAGAAAAGGGFAITDESGGLNLSVDDNFRFKASSFSILKPVSDKLKETASKIQEYLNQDSSKVLGITGYFTENETNNSAFPNLGLARANAVKNFFTSAGISSKQIDTRGEQNNNISPNEDDILYGPVGFSIKTLEEGSLVNKKEIAEIGANIKENPLLLRFKTGAASVSLTDQQRQKVADISKYIDKTDGTAIEIIGHTDNTGNRTNNMELGQNRADFIKQYLVENGIPENRINTSSQGPDNPIASNATEEGRAQNRRVVVTIN